MGLTSGTKLGPYEILSPLGAGGMGEVYRARDSRLGRDVAIKILPQHLSSNPDLKVRFEREARTISSLNHPHICHLYDIGSQDGTDYLVMEYLEGETLDRRLQKGPLLLKQALEYGVQMCEALEKAHRTGIVHRDLKPGNVILTASGAKLLDFGLAKPAPAVLSSGAPGPLTPSTPTMNLPELSAPAGRLTQQGTILGTFQYMAPEVLQGAEADASSDIFSFGCVLYEMVTGRRAFEGKSQFSVLGAILDKEPECITAVRPSLPTRLDETVRRCLAKNPDERYGCMHDVKIQLRALAEADMQTAVARNASGASSRLRLLVFGIATLIALLGAAGYLMLGPHPTPVVHASILPPPGTSFVTMDISSGPPVLSPDGTRLSFTARDDKSKVMLYVRPLNSMEAKPLTGTENAMYPFWSPDGREVGFFADSKLKRIDAGGGPPQTICDANNGRGGAWSKDGTILFTPVANSMLLRVPATGGSTAPATKLDGTQGENSHRWPQFLPDGKHFLFWMRSSRGQQEHVLYVGQLGSLEKKVVAKGGSMAVYASGYLLFMRDQTLMAQPFNSSRLELTGEAVPVVERVAINSATNRPMFSVSENGTLVYQTSETAGTWNLLWFARDGKQTGSVGSPDRYAYPALSPDGARLALNLYTVQGTGDVWTFDLARGTKTRLTFGPAVQVGPIWTPDGKAIFYASNAKGNYHVYAKAADGSGTERAILESSDASEVPLNFSPDGRYLIYQRRALTGSQLSPQIWALPLFGDRKPFPIVRTEFNESAGAVSPDGRWMAYEANDTGRMEVYITAFPGGGAKWQVSTSGAVEPRWRRDGKELFFLDAADNITAVDINASKDAVQLGVPHVLFRSAGTQRQQGPYDVSADGKKFLINTGNTKESSEPVTLVLNWPAELKN